MHKEFKGELAELPARMCNFSLLVIWGLESDKIDANFWKEFHGRFMEILASKPVPGELVGI